MHNSIIKRADRNAIRNRDIASKFIGRGTMVQVLISGTKRELISDDRCWEGACTMHIESDGIIHLRMARHHLEF